MRVSRYEGQTPDADDMLVTDDELEQAWTGRGVVTFCRRHIGIPLERARGMDPQRRHAA
jgi:two-component system capsular synthesis sensor histidine kinase RcsC